MRIKPVVMNNYISSYLDIDINLVLDFNICLIIGHSGTGKSFLWQVLRDDSTFNKDIVTYNYVDAAKNIEQDILDANGKLIVIDNADVLLNDDLRRHIALDKNNQYILFGRNPKCLFLSKGNFKKIKFADRSLGFVDAFY